LSTAAIAEVDGLAGWTVDLMERLGGPGAGLAIFLENIFPPLPSEVILPMAGFAARLGRLSVAEAIVWTTIGSVVGAWVIYLLGAWLGHDQMTRLATKLPLVDTEDLEKSASWFERHGTKGVFFGRMLPFFRSFISVPAGTERMNFFVFTALTTLGSLIWNSVFIGAGYALGANWHLVEPYASTLQYVVLSAIAAGIAWFFITRLRRKSSGR
jgi:membrane protein DedA with SNARE-associated domain